MGWCTVPNHSLNQMHFDVMLLLQALKLVNLFATAFLKEKCTINIDEHAKNEKNKKNSKRMKKVNTFSSKIDFLQVNPHSEFQKSSLLDHHIVLKIRLCQMDI